MTISCSVCLGLPFSVGEGCHTEWGYYTGAFSVQTKNRWNSYRISGLWISILKKQKTWNICKSVEVASINTAKFWRMVIRNFIEFRDPGTRLHFILRFPIHAKRCIQYTAMVWSPIIVFLGLFWGQSRIQIIFWIFRAHRIRERVFLRRTRMRGIVVGR